MEFDTTRCVAVPNLKHTRGRNIKGPIDLPRKQIVKRHLKCFVGLLKTSSSKDKFGGNLIRLRKNLCIQTGRTIGITTECRT